MCMSVSATKWVRSSTSKCSVPATPTNGASNEPPYSNCAITSPAAAMPKLAVTTTVDP